MAIRLRLGPVALGLAAFGTALGFVGHGLGWRWVVVVALAVSGAGILLVWVWVLRGWAGTLLSWIRRSH
jgi:hypothetical protein